MNKRTLESSIRMSDPQTLIPILERQVASGRITLTEQYIGDNGAYILADFLKQNQNIGLIDLKGNNIGPQGFLEVFEALKNNKALRTLQIAWNHLCANNNLQALEQLFQMMSVNKNITQLDLQNNSIKSTGAAIIANIIRNNPQLKSLDLRWNDIGTQGVQLLIGAIQANGYIQSVEVSGNGASEDTLKELNRVLNDNRQGQQPKFNSNGSSQDPYVRTIPYGNRMMVPPQQYQTNKPIQQVHIEDERQAVVRHLEKLVERERGHGTQMKEQLQGSMQEVKMKVASNQQKIESFEQSIISLQNEKNILISEQSKSENQIKDLQSKKSTIQRQMNERIDQGQKNKSELEKQHNSEDQQVQTEHFNQLRDLDKEWGQKCDEAMDNNRRVDEYNSDMLRKINEIKDEIHNFNQDSQSRTMDLVEKVKKMILSEFKEKLAVMETQINKIDEDRLKVSRKNKDTLTEAQKNLRKQVEEFEYMIKDKVRLGMENQDVSLKNKQFELFNKSLSLEVGNRGKLRLLLEQELENLKIKNEQVNDEDKQQFNQVINVQKLGQDKHDLEVDDLRKRSEAISKGLRDNDLENSRLYGDIQRLTELLQANASKVIYQTFSENNFI